MPIIRTFRRVLLFASLTIVAVQSFQESSRADTVLMKNGIVYRGTIDRDNQIIWVYDGLKRVVIRESKIAKRESDPGFNNLEVFKIDQPLHVHTGSMPKELLSVHAEPWNEKGRRGFEYEASRLGKTLRMTQAINEMGPHLVKIRGIDGFWLGQLATSQVPRDVILSILGKVDPKEKNERIRVVRFLIQSEWFPEARAELDRILKDFPEDRDLRERVNLARGSILQIEAADTKTRIDRARSAQQPLEVAVLLKKFPTKEINADLVTQVQELQRINDAQATADQALADGLRSLGDRLRKPLQPGWKKPVQEVLNVLKDAPDAVRDRFLAWQKAKLEGGKSDEAQFSLAMSGYVVGADAAVTDLNAATTLWTMREQIRDYLTSSDSETRSDRLAKLEGAVLPGDEAQPLSFKKLDTVTRLAIRMTPPLNSGDMKRGLGPITHRVRIDENDEPTEYTVTLPREYHPLRSYPTILALHDGTGLKSAIAWWSAEATKRGYIVVAPEFLSRGAGKEYLYTPNEHASIELSLRDAKRRYSIDSDRVFVGGQLVGANAAWDFGLAHPDLFAGIVSISGFPFKYVLKNLPHTEKLPCYFVLGDLAPAANEVVFGQILKPLIGKAWDVTYLEYMKRGMEDFPEEAPATFDWMDRRKREPYPKTFSFSTSRTCDNRFYGIVTRELQPERTPAPEVVDPMGKNLNPATIVMRSSKLSNLISLDTKGVKRLDVWLTPSLIDFSKRVEVKINKTSRFKGLIKPDLGPLLEDLRIRADRHQIYWVKVPIG